MQDQVIDQDALKRLLAMIGGEPEDLEELFDDFETETPKTLAKMTEAARSADLTALRIASHSLKSNGRDFGATALAAACEALEHACKAGQVDQPEARVAEISAELDRARAALGQISLK